MPGNITKEQIEQFMKKNNITSYAAAEMLMEHEKKHTVCGILEEVMNTVCDKLCKYPQEYADKYGEDDERMYEEVCDKCILKKII